jgi:hypothetical protein
MIGNQVFVFCGKKLVELVFFMYFLFEAELVVFEWTISPSLVHFGCTASAE